MLPSLCTFREPILSRQRNPAAVWHLLKMLLQRKSPPSLAGNNTNFCYYLFPIILNKSEKNWISILIPEMSRAGKELCCLFQRIHSSWGALGRNVQDLGSGTCFAHLDMITWILVGNKDSGLSQRIAMLLEWAHNRFIHKTIQCVYVVRTMWKLYAMVGNNYFCINRNKVHGLTSVSDGDVQLAVRHQFSSFL